jgi:hypothetical protein
MTSSAFFRTTTIVALATLGVWLFLLRSDTVSSSPALAIPAIGLAYFGSCLSLVKVYPSSLGWIAIAAGTAVLVLITVTGWGLLVGTIPMDLLSTRLSPRPIRILSLFVPGAIGTVVMLIVLLLPAALGAAPFPWTG